MIIQICKGKLPVQVEFVKSKPTKMLFIEKEVLDSMNTNGSKTVVSMNFKLYKEDKITYRNLYYAILRQINLGNSTFTDIAEVDELFNIKEYYTINKQEYGDYYENKILHTKDG